MFYPFAEHLPHGTRSLPVIWRVESAICTVLMDANESEDSVRRDELDIPARQILEGQKLDPAMHAECFAELEYMLQNGQGALQAVIERLGIPAEKSAVRALLKPDRDRILAAVGTDPEFAGFLRNLSRSGGSE